MHEQKGSSLHFESPSHTHTQQHQVHMWRVVSRELEEETLIYVSTDFEVQTWSPSSSYT